MSDSELLIKINGDVENFKEAMGNAVAEGVALNEALNKLAEVSGELFEKVVHTIEGAVEAFVEADNASRKLSNALQNQGVYTTELKQEYDEYAESISQVTGISKAQITSAQAVAQTYLGQMPVTKELTKAMADLAVEQGVSVPQAAEMLSKAIGNGTGMLLRQGLQFAATDTEADRYRKTLEFVQLKAGDAATAIDPLELAQKRLNNTFEEGRVALGQRFAPAITAAIDALNNFLQPSTDAGDSMTDLKAGFLFAAAGVTALGVALPVAAQAFLAVRAAAMAFNITLNGTKIALAGIGIGLLIIALTELVTHWQWVSDHTIAIVKGMVVTISEAFGGIAEVIKGAFTLDLDRVKTGLKQIQDAFTHGTAVYKDTLKEREKATEQHEQVQDASRKKAADKAQAVRDDADKTRIARAKAQHDLLLMELNDASDEAIALKKQEVQELTALENSKDETEKTLLRQKIAQTRELEEDQRKTDLEREKTYDALYLEADKDLADRRIANTETFNDAEEKALKKSILTQEQAQNDVYKKELQEQIKAHNTFLTEQIKYGTAYATINRAIHSDEVDGFKSATSELVGLTQSKNETLKMIGKAASIAQITIKTAESAMNVLAGFSVIPFVGEALGMAAAGAVIAFGAEQIGNVTAAQSGALVPGAGFGDKVPFMLEPGELVAPRKSFDEVVNGVAKERGMQPAGEAQGGRAVVELRFTGDAGKYIEATLVERQRLGVSVIKTKLS